MKVLEKGNWDNPWSAEMKCTEKSCGAKLLVEEKDVSPVDYSTYGFYAECMVCGHHMLIKGSELPARLVKELEKKRKYYSSDW